MAAAGIYIPIPDNGDDDMHHEAQATNSYCNFISSLVVDDDDSNKYRRKSKTNKSFVSAGNDSYDYDYHYHNTPT